VDWVNTIETSKPAVSVIVPCRNERDCIELAVRSILAQEPPRGGFEVIASDGMSDDGTRAILTRLAQTDPRLRIVDNPGKIVSTGLNSALRVAQGGIIMRMDAHTEYAPNYIRKCIAVLNATRADNVGGPWVAKGDGLIGQAIAAAFQAPFAVGNSRGHDPCYEGVVDTVYLGCWRRKAFDRFGLFDEELVRNQDDEFNLRIWRAGGRVWQSPSIKSWYKPRESLFALVQQYMQYGYWKVRVIQKHSLPASLRHLVPACFVLSLIALPFAFSVYSLATWIWLFLLGTYVLCNLVASILTSARVHWKLLFLLPLVFAGYHFSYGYGFLRGLLDFIILRREATSGFSSLTRTSADKSIPATKFLH
jgi:glycosyltransferase involved in cell wall biosynthesis